MQRLRVEKMERQLANLTGLVQKALQVPNQSPAPIVTPRQEYQVYQPPRPATQGKLLKPKTISLLHVYNKQVHKGQRSKRIYWNLFPY